MKLFISIIFKIFLSILLFYSSLVSIYINFTNKQFDFLSLFFSFSLCFLCLLLLYHIYRKAKILLEKKETINIKSPPPYFLALILISLLIGFFNVYSQYPRGLHIAEIAQFMESKNVMGHSYRQQQPPLDYYFSAFAKKVLDQSKFALRFHTMLFYLLLCLILPFGLYYYSSFLISILGSLLFLINHTTRLHSVDGRPLNLALLTGFLFLFFYINFIESKEKQSLIPIICSQYLFIISIGLQPVIFTISLFFSSFFTLYLLSKEVFKKLLLSNLIVAFLTCPFYLQMISFGREAKKFKELSFSSIIHYLSELRVTYFIQEYFLSFYDKMFLSFLVPLLGWIFLISFKRKKPNKNTLLLLFSTILFPLFFDILFSVGIWYGKNYWYFIIFSLFLIFLFTFISQDLNSYLKNNKYYLYILIPYLLLFFGNYYSQNLKIKNESQFYHPYQDNSIEKVYEYLKKNGNSKDLISELKLISFLSNSFENEIQGQSLFFHNSNVHPSNFILSSSPYIEESPFFYELDSLDFYYSNKINQKVNKIFFIARTKNEGREDVSEEILSLFLPKKIIGEFAIFELALFSKNKQQEYIDFLYRIKSKTPKKYQSHLLETLLYYSYQKKQKTKFKKLLQEYKELTNYMSEYTTYLKYPTFFEHKRRIKYFKQLNWEK